MIEILTPDSLNTKDEPQEVKYLRDGQPCTLFEAIGTTLDQTPVINHFGVSGGKDSDALLLWAKYRSEYDPKSILATTCETFNEDRVTYDHIAVLREKVCPIHRIVPYRGFLDLAKRKKMFPMRKKRFCTEHLKMVPTRYFVHALSDAGFKVILHSGVRASESTERAKLDAWEGMDSFFGLPIHRPLLAWTMQEVVQIHRDYSIPFNPLYALGVGRVGCCPCINSVKREVRIISSHRPETINKLLAWEDELTEVSGGNPKTFFHRKTVPIRFRSVKSKDKNGKTIMVASIHDVVRWSQSGPRAREETNQLMPFVEDSFKTCTMNYGACE